MVNSRFEYVKQFESEDFLLPETYIVVNVNSKNIEQFNQDHPISQPFDNRLIRLFSRSARHVMEDFTDIDISFIFQDSFTFIFNRTSTTFNRRRDKILTNLISLLSSTIVYNWKEYFDDEIKMKYPILFVGSIELVSRKRNIIKYLKDKQMLAVECCIDLYTNEVMKRNGKISDEKLSFSDKNEYLFKNGINFNFFPPWHRRGKVLVRDKKIIECSDDLTVNVKNNFWKKHKNILK